MEIKYWLKKTILKLENISSSPRCDAEILLNFVLGKKRSWLYTFDDFLLNSEQIVKLQQVLKQRILGKPIAYIIGEREFWSLPIKVSNVTLIPRPETELLVELALSYIDKKSGIILDMGTGTGAIALALAKELINYKIYGIDRILSAVNLARKNAFLLSLNNVCFFYSYWFNELVPCQYDMIISNPPYVDIKDIHLNIGDVRFEPLSAVVSDHKGFADLYYLITKAQKWLKSGGFLLLEHGWKQGKIVESLMHKYGYILVKTHLDYLGHPRVTCGCKP